MFGFRIDRYGTSMESVIMDQSEQTRTVVMDLLQRVAAGDPAKIAELYAENVTWKLGWPEEEIGGSVPWIRRRSTRADVEDHYRTLRAGD